MKKSDIEKFRDEGIVVISDILTVKELEEAKTGFHSYLLRKGCDPDNLIMTGNTLSSLSSTGGSGGVLDVFYESWKLKLSENLRIFNAISELWEATYATNLDHNFSHPFGPFDPKKGFIYIDRVCYRIPEHVSVALGTKKGKKTRKLQRFLAPHLDCCPHRMYESDKKHPKWKPIQAFVALTDTLEPNQGGFEACPGFHKQFDRWSSNRMGINNISKSVQSSDPKNPPCVGDFTPIRPLEDVDVIRQFQHISCRAGDLVVWDYRIPHGNARYNFSPHPREVIYIGFLPDIELNRKYARVQLEAMLRGEPPTDQWHENHEIQPFTHEFSPLGRLLIALDPWSYDTNNNNGSDNIKNNSISNQSNFIEFSQTLPS